MISNILSPRFTRWLVSAARTQRALMMVTLIVAVGPISHASAETLAVISSNRFLSNSTSNPFSLYNNSFNPDSPRNRFGRFGNPFPPYSANNPFTTNGLTINVPEETQDGDEEQLSSVDWDNENWTGGDGVIDAENGDEQ